MTDSGRLMVSRDHILCRKEARKLPRAKGFRASVQQTNILMCCRSCNIDKDQMTLPQWLAVQAPGSFRAMRIAAVMDDIRAKHSPEVFVALMGLSG